MQAGLKALYYSDLGDIKMKNILFIILSILTVATTAQNPKKPFRSAKKLVEDKNYESAIKELNQAISIDNKFTDAYVLRAEVLQKTNQFSKAANDYKTAAALDPKVVDYHFNAGKLFYRVKNYQNALTSLKEVVILDDENFQAYQYKAFTHIKLKEFEKAIVAINNALKLSGTYLSFYTRGVAYDSLQNYNQAIQDYNKTIAMNPDYDKAYFALSKVFVHNGDYTQALNTANIAVQRFGNNPDVYKNRSFIYHEMGQLPNAINDLTRLETMVENNVEVLFLRGTYYFKYGQYQNATSDFSQVLARSYDYIDALYWRGRAYEEMMLEEEALRDYERYLDFAANKKSNPKWLYEVKTKLFSLKKENNGPIIIIDTPRVVNNKLAILNNSTLLDIRGIVQDESRVESLTINDTPVIVTEANSFNYVLSIDEAKSVNIEAIDTYGNKTTKKYGLKRIEIDPPLVKLNTPYAGDNGEIYLDSNDANLFVEGKIQDKSLIKDIYINNVRASFNDKELNPRFTATVNIENRDRLDVVAIDAYENVLETTYMLNRQGTIITDNNPMGKTWVVFIENSEYDNFASLEGPAKDANFIKQGLSEYQIHNFIHKKNLTKKELERFFSIELRNQVKKNNVRSLLIWYAGHGKMENQTGYWIPVDAQPNDEFTFYNINNLRAGMLSYIGFINHTLVVTDACESGAAFYMAARGVDEIPSCNNTEATHYRSAQVLTSTGHELADDYSLFARTFAKSLMANTKTCLPIEKIVKTINKTVTLNQQQKPKFGVIKGFEDEGGTFFFIKK